MYFLFGIGSIGIQEILLLLLIALLVFGASRLPEIGRGLGQGIMNFKKSVKGEDKTPPQDPGKPQP